MDINSTLVKTIDYIVSQRINDLPIDKTVTGVIESKNEDGTYSILEGSLRFAALGNGQNYRSGQQVLVLIPGGDYSNDNKVILGLKSAMATSEQLMPYVRPRDKMIHVDDEGIKGLIEGQVYRNIENYYRRCNCVSVSANVKTNFTHNITEGSYGLLVHILDGEKIVETLDLNNKKDMFGNTFKFVTALPQEVTYSVDLSGVSLNGLGVKYETYIGDLYYINDNNQKVLYHPTGEEITFSNIVVSFGFDTTQKPAKELDFLLKDADTLQLLWYNMDASGKSWEFTDGEFNLDYAINYKKYQEQVNEMLILEDYSALTDEEQALFKKLYNPEEGKEAKVFDQLRKGEYKGVNPFDDIYYGVEWKITNKKESGLWKAFETDGKLREVKPRQSKWQNTYVKAIVYRNGEIFEKVYDGVFENLTVTETSEDGHIYYTGIKLIHDQSSCPHYDCYGYTNLVTNSEDKITRKVKWSSILNEEYSIEEPPKLQPIGTYWYVSRNNTMLVPIGEKNEEKPMAGYDCYKADVFDYKIKSHFAPYDKNNTLKCRVYLDNVNYYEAELTFSFTTKGTMGTDYGLIIKEEQDRYVVTSSDDSELDFSASIVRDPNGQEIKKRSEENPNGVEITVKEPEAYPGIVEVTASWNRGESRLKAYQPIALNRFSSTLYYQGPTEVVYDSLGSNPRYDKSSPKLIDENGAVLEGIVWSNTITNTGGMTELAVESSYTSMADYQIKTIKATLNEKVIWEQPIIMFQDVYGNSYLNKWDGKLSLDNSTGRVLTSMIGAGHKDEENKFTGVLMGDVQKTDKSAIETGVFGLSKGVQTFALKTDGSAIIGREGNGITFDGEKSEIRNADGSVLIDFTDEERENTESNEIVINLNAPGVTLEKWTEENIDSWAYVESSTSEINGVKYKTDTYKVPYFEEYRYEKQFLKGKSILFSTDNTDTSCHVVNVEVNGKLIPLSGTLTENDLPLKYAYTVRDDEENAEEQIGKVIIQTRLHEGLQQTVEKTVIVITETTIGPDGEEIAQTTEKDYAIKYLDEFSRTDTYKDYSTKYHKLTYEDRIPRNSSLRFQNGKFSFTTDEFDIQAPYVSFTGDHLTITSGKRITQQDKRVLDLSDSNYLLRTNDFAESLQEGEYTEFNLVTGIQYNNSIYGEINKSSTIRKLNNDTEGLAFKTDTLQLENGVAEVKVKSAGEGANITVRPKSKGCSPRGYWLKAFVYDKSELTDKGYYGTLLDTVYIYAGDDGKKVYTDVSAEPLKIVPRKVRTVSTDLQGAEFNLMKQTLKMACPGGSLYIGTDEGDNLSDVDAAGKIFIGGEKYALRIGAFKIDWNGNQVQ